MNINSLPKILSEYLYDWKDIQNDICNVLEIPENSIYYRYNDINYDIRSFFLDHLVPDEIFDGSVIYLYEIDELSLNWYKESGETYKTILANAYNTVYNMLCNDNSGIYVQWYW